MSSQPDGSPAPAAPAPVRLMVDFSTGRIVGAQRPAAPVPGAAGPADDRDSEPLSREAA